jgi:uncharacterized protein (UPF0147 family)
MAPSPVRPPTNALNKTGLGDTRMQLDLSSPDEVLDKNKRRKTGETTEASSTESIKVMLNGMEAMSICGEIAEDTVVQLMRGSNGMITMCFREVGMQAVLGEIWTNRQKK